jgi:hypothetical protein
LVKKKRRVLWALSAPAYMQGRSANDQHYRFILPYIAPAMRQIAFEVQCISWLQAVMLAMNGGCQRTLQAVLKLFPLMPGVAPSASRRHT